MLSLYELDETSGQFVPFTKNGDLTNPILATLNGATGDYVVTRIFLRNDDATKYYKGISIVPSVAFASYNASIKMLSGEPTPTSSEWASVSSGNLLQSTTDPTSKSNPREWLYEIGSTGHPDVTYHPIYLRIEVEPGAPIDLVSNLTLTVTATDYLV